MAPRKSPTPTARRPYEAGRFYAVDLARVVDWKGSPLIPGHDLQVRGAILNQIDDQDAITHARPL
ncbi:MAG: hypothetical protein KBC34_00925 [Phenylobacterium sp.]|nr:hypothetical protein [Phenylobacterium sp.]